MPSILFLDIDGVLNDHTWSLDAQSCTIDAHCAGHLNTILIETGCSLVLSSAWRYLIGDRHMTLLGFEALLRSHGVAAKDKLLGYTRRDEDCVHCDHQNAAQTAEEWNTKGYLVCRRCQTQQTRGRQISQWLGDVDKTDYVVLDDLDLGITAAGHPLVQTERTTGLTAEKAKEAIRILKGILWTTAISL